MPAGGGGGARRRRAAGTRRGRQRGRLGLGGPTQAERAGVVGGAGLHGVMWVAVGGGVGVSGGG